MDILRRIDKGYILVEKARSKANEISNDKKILELEERLNKLSEKEAMMRDKINFERNKLMEKENLLADLDRKLSKVLEEIYEIEVTDNGKLENLKKKEKEIKGRREKIQTDMLQDFTNIDNYVDELNIFKHKYNLFEERVSKIRVCNHEKVIYLEDKIKLMEKKIRKLRKMASPDLLKLYDDKRNISNIVFSKVEGKSCSLCKSKISEEILAKIKESKELTECSFCRRILFTEVSEKDENYTL